MKAFILLVTFTYFAGAFALTAEQKVKVLKYAQECSEKHSVPVEEYVKLKEGDFANNNGEKHQCFVQCFLEKSGFLKGGELQEAAIFEKLSGTLEKDKIQAVMNICKKEKGANDCETAFKMFQCTYNNKASLQ